MMTTRTIVLRDNIQMPNVRNMYITAVAMHLLMFIWNPTLMSGGAGHEAPVLRMVEFRDKAPLIPPPPPVVKKELPRPVAPKAHKSGLSSSEKLHAAAQIRPVKRHTKIVANPAPRSRPAPVKMPKFVPHASDDDALISASPHQKVATTTALRPASTNAPVLRGRSRGIKIADMKFELTDRSGISSTFATKSIAVPVGEERGAIAAVASAAPLHNAPRGIPSTSGAHFDAPLGDGVGVLAGKNRPGYVGGIQVGMPSEEQVIAAGSQRGGAAVGKGVEIGGPVGDRKILRKRLPEYPVWAEEKGISAMVKIFFTVKADGSIRRTVRVVTSSGYSDLDSLAKDALLEWKFSPTSANSSADEAWGVITFRFTLA